MGKLGEGHPVFAALWGVLHSGIDPFRSRVVAEAAGHVLEVGAGGGENLPFYRDARSVVLTEPDPYMVRRAVREARALGSRLPAEVVPAAAEALPFESHSFDTAVVTLAFCSVEDTLQALSEVRRVLKPGGTFRFLEHVRASTPRWAGLQDLINPAWHAVSAGCNLNRDTLGAMGEVGFEITELERLESRLLPIYTGVARVR